MSEPEQPNNPPPLTTMRRKVLVNFGLFSVFFLFYLGAALIQTPSCREVATIDTIGMPLGLLLSLAIFPVSWVIIAIWFSKAR
jgi:hypothetical protein